MHRTGPRNPLDEEDLLTVGARARKELTPKVGQLLETVKGSLVGNLPGIHHMGSKLAGVEENGEASLSELGTAGAVIAQQ